MSDEKRQRPSEDQPFDELEALINESRLMMARKERRKRIQGQKTMTEEAMEEERPTQEESSPPLSQPLPMAYFRIDESTNAVDWVEENAPEAIVEFPEERQQEQPQTTTETPQTTTTPQPTVRETNTEHNPITIRNLFEKACELLGAKISVTYSTGIEYHAEAYDRKRIWPPSRYLDPDMFTRYNREHPNPRDTINRNLPVDRNPIVFDSLVETSPKDSGKTYAILRYIISLLKKDPNARILIISFRISFTTFINTALQAVFAEYGITAPICNYLDFKDSIEEIEAIEDPVERAEQLDRARRNYHLGDRQITIVQIDSLGRICKKTSRPYDLLVVDEWTSITRRITALKEKNQITEWIVHLLDTSVKTFISDADFTQTSLNTLSSLYARCSNKRIKLCINILKNDRRFFHLFANKPQLFMKLLDDLKAGLRCVVCTNALKYAKLCAEFIRLERVMVNGRRLRIRLITRETRINEDERLDSQDWDQYDLLIYTSVVLAGISFDVPYYHRCYGIFVNCSNVAEECAQMLSRVRNLLHSMVLLYVVGKCKESYDLSTIQMERVLIGKHEAVRLFGSCVDRFLLPGGLRAFLTNSYTLIHSTHMLESRKSVENLKGVILGIVRRYMPQPRFQIREVPEKRPKNGLKEIKERIRAGERQEILAASVIDAIEAERIHKLKDRATDEERAQKRRYDIIDFYKIDQEELTEEFIEKWGSEGRMHKMDMFDAVFLQSEDDLQRRDEAKVASSGKKDSLFDLKFLLDQRSLYTNLLDIFGFTFDRLLQFRVDLTRLYLIDITRINEILPKFILRDNHRKFPTEISHYESIPTIIRTAFGAVGIPHKTNKTTNELLVDEEALLDILRIQLVRLVNHESLDALQHLEAMVAASVDERALQSRLEEISLEPNETGPQERVEPTEEVITLVEPSSPRQEYPEDQEF